MTAQTHRCVVCGRPEPDAYACRPCAQELAQALTTAAGHAEDAWTVIARQARYGSAYPGRPDEADPYEAAVDDARNPVRAFGWAASIERPVAGALRPGITPPDLSASARLAEIGNTVTTWARHVCEHRGVELPARRPRYGPLCGTTCTHGSCAGIRLRRPPSDLGEAAAWLATQVDWLRKRPEAAEAFDELHDACLLLRRLVDRPASEPMLVGVCDCGATLYAPAAATVVECSDPKCKLRWDVEASRAVLREALRDRLVTAADAAHLAAYWDDRTSEQIRKLVNAWTSRGQLAPHGWLGDYEPAYRFGEIVDRLARTPRRAARAAEDARMSA